jgi:hypothetical protein
MVQSHQVCATSAYYDSLDDQQKGKITVLSYSFSSVLFTTIIRRRNQVSSLSHPRLSTKPMTYQGEDDSVHEAPPAPSLPNNSSSSCCLRCRFEISDNKEEGFSNNSLVFSAQRVWKVVPVGRYSEGHPIQIRQRQEPWRQEGPTMVAELENN